MKEDILSKIIERACEIWKVTPDTLSENTEFATLNPKSAHYSQMTTFLEDEFDVEVPYLGFKRAKTFKDAVEYVAELLEEE
ncbi:MAG: acyl carrier protein [Suipraeoptans sp.]